MVKGIVFDYSLARGFVREQELEYMKPALDQAHRFLGQQEGPGKEFAGWVSWPLDYDREEFARVQECGQRLREKAQALIVIGIGGSYLGARSALELLNHTYYNQLPREARGGPEIYFAGTNISTASLAHLLDLVREKDFYVNVISKSGTTLEPALAFRVFRWLLEERWGKEGARQRIIATTDREKGALKKLSREEGYETFTVPGNIGGRYSVLTAVGLLPIAAGGVDIQAVMAGAREGCQKYNVNPLEDNPALQYALLRNILYHKGKTLELLVNYEPSLGYFTEWWKQLFGESEGKDQKGIFPAGVNFTTDLHSLGQYIQDGFRNLFTTTLWVEKPSADLEILPLDEDIDGLNYLAGKSLHQVNQKACQGTMLAHTSGGVPNLKITVPELTPYYYGQLVYFFEVACGVSGYLLGVNPFDQPGVEAYKKKMFELLGRP